MWLFQGCAQVSLADFDPKRVSCVWYNVLSFKFMQADSRQSSSRTSLTNSTPSSLTSSSPMVGAHTSQALGLTHFICVARAQEKNENKIQQLHRNKNILFWRTCILSVTLICCKKKKTTHLYKNKSWKSVLCRAIIDPVMIYHPLHKYQTGHTL